MVVAYEDWLTRPGCLKDVEEHWAGMDRRALCTIITSLHPESVIEFCCGTGWIPKGLSPDIDYLGIDANGGCIDLAVKKNPTRSFLHADIRNLVKALPCDLAIAFSCLKHFTLDDWDDVYGRILRAGKATLTSIYLRDEDIEEQQHPYIHTAVTREHMERVIAANGHRLVEVFELPPLVTGKEPLVLTKAIDERVDLVSTEGLREGEPVGGGAVPLRDGLLGRVQGEAEDSGGEDPDDSEEGPGQGPPQAPEWLG